MLSIKTWSIVKQILPLIQKKKHFSYENKEREKKTEKEHTAFSARAGGMVAKLVDKVLGYGDVEGDGDEGSDQNSDDEDGDRVL